MAAEPVLVAAFYGLAPQRAKLVVEEVATAVDGWQDEARKAGISAADIALTRTAFSAHTEYRRGSKALAGS